MADPDRGRVRPRRRPPWWPANEPWPPLDAPGPAARARHGRAIWPALGCLVGGVMLLALLGAAAIIAEVLSAILGPLGLPTRPITWLAFAALLVAMLGLSRGFRRLADPLGELVRAARRVEAGAYDARVPELRRGPRELRELTHAFNTMTSRLEADQRQRRSLLADVSHELRTPLAVLRGNLEAIADGIHPADPAHLAGLIEETNVLERLVEDLRTISLAEAGALPLHREPTDLDVLVGETAAAFAAEAGSAGVTLRVVTPEDLPLLDVDPVRIREVIANLVANALRHTPAGGTVTVAGRRDAGAVELVVSDTGPGIEPDLLPHVFERFAKGRASRGTGLGLAIAADLVAAHGGTIVAHSDPGHGATFTMRLPYEAGREA